MNVLDMLCNQKQIFRVFFYLKITLIQLFILYNILFYCFIFYLYLNLLHLKILNCFNQWSSRCAPVHTSVHENYFTVQRKYCKIIVILFYSDILGIL